MPRKKLTVGGVEQLLQARIQNGEYLVGSRLPTVRELADELKVNRNTTVRAYQALKRKGYLELTRGRGAFVRAARSPAASADSRWLAKLDHLLEQAKAQGLPRSVVLHELSASVDRLFGTDHGAPRLAFVECNLPDIQVLGDEISSVIGYPLEGVLLSDFVAQPQKMVERFDLIVTTFFHLGEVSWALPDEMRARVIGVLAKPTHDSLLKIARLRAQVIGLVVTLASTIDNLVNIIHTYHPSATILPAQMGDEARLQMLLNKADALVVTRVTYERLMERSPKIPVVMVSFTIDQQSIDFLRTRIWEKQGAPTHDETDIQINGAHAL